MRTYSCRLCGSSNIKQVLSLERMPRDVQRLLKKEELASDQPIKVIVYSCNGCGFVQLKPHLEDDYYDEYLMTTSHSAQMQNYQAEQASDFVRRFSLVGKKVIEMGCGDGNYLVHLASSGAIPAGIEPSTTFRELAIPRGFPIEDGYITADRDLAGGPYDAFVSRQVLEHVPMIHDFLQGIRRNLKPGAYGLVEVPSLEKALKDRRFYDFFPDHVNYFSHRTLRAALELNGFDVLEVDFGMYDEYNVALVRNPEPDNLSLLQETVVSLAIDIEQFIKKCKSHGQTVAVWGAGGKGLSVMSAADMSSVDLLIDSDPHKHDLYTPISHLKVSPPDILEKHNVDAIILTAMAYSKEIIHSLRTHHRFKGTIAVLGHHLEISS